ncbi:uncharacterized protein LOC115311409 [Ixodes scapularis]|uniref:uncharacterized protein LOC115311409 n=1 Tax=Ixodes scapularis TaxID=6945 RepID=UPI0011619D89|nr:uncharacterized protein LOC115311409 [Ixodes scapularis]
MAARLPNEDDCDGASYLPPVQSEPVVRLLQPMIDGEEEHYDYMDAHNRPTSPSPLSEPEVTSAACTSASVVDTGAAQSNGHSRAHAIQPPAAAAARYSIDGTDASSHAATRLPKGRMAVLENSLAKENEVRETLLREEHALRLRLMKEDHDDKLQKRATEHSLEMEIKRAKKELVLLKLEQLKQAEK